MKRSNKASGICASREQALLCMIASEARPVNRHSNGHASRTALMMGFCYAKLMGTRSMYQFDIFPSGPFCQQVLADLGLLEVEGALSNFAVVGSDHADYVCDDAALSLMSRFGLWLEEERPKVRRILQAIAPLTRKHLAMVAHTHFAWLWWTNNPDLDRDIREQVIQEVMAAELPGATEAKLQAIYDNLLGLGIIVTIPGTCPEEGVDHGVDSGILDGLPVAVGAGPGEGRNGAAV